MRDIQVFFGFVNFYRRFIQSFSKIAELLISMLRMSFAIRSSKNLLVSINVAQVDEVSVDIGSSDRQDKTVGRSPSKNLNGTTGYLISDARQILLN